jgi:predicted small metal-binding protein
MSQKSEDLLQSFFIQCSDVGLNCDCVVFGKSEEKVNDAMIMHMDEYHAIIPKEMTTCMRLRIRENIHSYRDSVRAEILREFPDVSEKLLPVV